MLLTVCTIARLPDALTLGASFGRHHPDEPVVIGLADDPARLPAGFTCPYPILTAADCMPGNLPALSAGYTPTEFAAAGKPAFVRAAFDRFPQEQCLLYADPETFIYQPLTSVLIKLQGATALLTPHLTRPPADDRRPDEKALQNVGLYSAGFLALRRSDETDRLLIWWQDRVTERAFISPCDGLCTDQLWLMYWPVFFEGVRVIKNAGWQVALWNLGERRLTPDSAKSTTTAVNGWQVNGSVPLLFANFRGLTNPDAGFFVSQTRLRLRDRPDVRKLAADYQRQLQHHERPELRRISPAFGAQPEPMVLRGWKRTVATAARQIIQFIDRVPIPVFR